MTDSPAGPAGIIDLHSHLVPGVDDGARSVEDALEGIGRMRSAGVVGIVTTPHLDGSLTLDPKAFEARMREFEAGWAPVLEAARGAYPDLPFSRANEVRLDHPEPDLSDPRLRIRDTPYVLVEWPRMQIPPGTPRVISRLVSQGVVPVIAHPERYQGFDARMAIAESWREEGAVLQMNHGSILGRYGPVVQERAILLLRRGGVDVLSSDFHGRPGLPVMIRESRRWFEDSPDGPEVWNLLTSVNPRRLVEGDRMTSVPPLGMKSGVYERIRSFIRGGRS